MHRKVQFCHQEILLFLQCLAPVVKTMEDVNSFVSPFQTEQNLNVSVPQVFWIRMENPAMVFFFILSHSIMLLLIFFVLTFLNNEKLQGMDR